MWVSSCPPSPFPCDSWHSACSIGCSRAAPCHSPSPPAKASKPCKSRCWPQSALAQEQFPHQPHAAQLSAHSNIHFCC